MNPLASMNEGSLSSNANMTSFMGKEIELLKNNFSGEDYRNIEVTATKSLKIVYSTIPLFFFFFFFAIKLIIVSFKKERKKKKKKKWWHARLMRWNLERNK